MSNAKRNIVLNFSEDMDEVTAEDIRGNPEVIRAYLGDAEAV